MTSTAGPSRDVDIEMLPAAAATNSLWWPESPTWSTRFTTRPRPDCGGMLVADPAHRGQGIGRELVIFAEELTRRRGLPIMQLELLVPREWSHPEKEFLHAWYTRIGYQPVRSGRIDESYPHLAPLLATACDFVVYHKALATLGSAD